MISIPTHDIVEELKIEYPDSSCPIAGCEWTFSAPAIAGQPSAYMTTFRAVEVLVHVVGRYGADGRAPHTPEEIEQTGLEAILTAAGLR